MTFYMKALLGAWTWLSTALLFACIAVWARSTVRLDRLYINVGDHSVEISTLRHALWMRCATPRYWSSRFESKEQIEGTRQFKHFFIIRTDPPSPGRYWGNPYSYFLGFVYMPPVEQRITDLPNRPGRTYTFREFSIPFYFLAALTAVTPVGSLVTRSKRKQRLRAGHCPQCDYDLRAHTAPGDRCPECGHPTPATKPATASPAA